MRQLASQGHDIFVKVQRAKAAAVEQHRGCMGSVEGEEFSKEYRALLQACLESESKDGVDGMDDGSQDHGLGHMFHAMDSVWHLSEIFLIRGPNLVRSGGHVIHALTDEWLVQHFRGPIENLHELNTDVKAVGMVRPEDTPHFWPTVFGLLFQRQISTVMQVLRTASAADRAHGLNAVLQLLSEMPPLHAGVSYGAFRRQWDNWQTQCRDALLESDFRLEYKLICRILGGDIGGTTCVFAESIRLGFDLTAFSPTWYQLLIARLSYDNPLAKVFEVDAHIGWAKETLKCAGREDPTENEYGELLQAAMESDTLKLIKNTMEFFPDSCWFTAHLQDLLLSCGLVDYSDPSFGGRSREQYILEYANSLFEHKSLWSVAPAYFNSCPLQGRQHLEAYIERVPVTSSRTALKILDVCQKFGMQTQLEGICRVLGRKSSAQGRYGDALEWFLRAGDVSSVDNLANVMLHDYKNRRAVDSLFEFDASDILDKFGVAILVSKRLTFMAKYKEFLSRRSAADFAGAATVLITIFEHTTLAPKWFWLDMLLDALPLLEHPRPVFDIHQTRTLLRCFTELSISHQSDAFVGSGAEHAAQVEPLRLALARNLARAIIS